MHVVCVDTCDDHGEQSHPGKIVERHWYERNKHIFPASRWEVVRHDARFHHRWLPPHSPRSVASHHVAALWRALWTRWQYDPAVKRDRYTIHGDEIR